MMNEQKQNKNSKKHTYMQHLQTLDEDPAPGIEEILLKNLHSKRLDLSHKLSNEKEFMHFLLNELPKFANKTPPWTKFRFNNNRAISSQGFSQLFDNLRANFDSISEICVSNNNFGDLPAFSLMDLIEKNAATLKVLHLAGNALTPLFTRKLFEKIRFEIQLRELSLDDNDILGDEGISFLSKILYLMPKLQVLKLENTSLTFNGIKDLCDGLLTKSLQVLDLERNYLQDQGCYILSRFLLNNQFNHLQILNVGSNDVTDAGLHHYLQQI